MSLWGWTLEAYARPGVPEACLELQDEYGQNTSYLLWAVWGINREDGRHTAPTAKNKQKNHTKNNRNDTADSWPPTHTHGEKATNTKK